MSALIAYCCVPDPDIADRIARALVEEGLAACVNRLPGVQSSYFGPGVGRPIIRGLDGARVQVLSDGLASGDVSTAPGSLM